MYFTYAFLACVLCTASGLDIPKILFQKLKTNIFYETLDQSSIDFFKKFENYYTPIQAFVEVNLVPFGNASLTKVGGTITCENGEVECYGNRVHACAISLLTKTEDEIEFVVCTMNYTNPKTVTKDSYPASKCILMLNTSQLTMDLLEKCIADESTKLLEVYANETKHLETINHWPVITLNEDPFNTQVSSDLVHNFQDAVCQKLSGVPGISAVCDKNTTTAPSHSTTPAPHSTTPHPSSATIVSTAYWPLFVAIVLTVLFEVKVRY